MRVLFVASSCLSTVLVSDASLRERELGTYHAEDGLLTKLLSSGKDFFRVGNSAELSEGFEAFGLHQYGDRAPRQPRFKKFSLTDTDLVVSFTPDGLEDHKALLLYVSEGVWEHKLSLVANDNGSEQERQPARACA